MNKMEVGKLLKMFRLLSFVILIAAALIIGAVPAHAAKAANVAQGKASLVDINSATQAELEAIKGIGPATAKKIIEGRPYKSLKDLTKAGVSEKAVEAMKPFVKVGKVPAAEKAAAPVKAATSDVKKAAKEAKTTAASDVKKTAKEAKETAASDVKKAAKEVKTTAKATTEAAKTKLAPGTKVNINKADLATLEALPEIGPVKAQAIIDGRPYKTIEDVMKVSGIKEQTFEAIKGYIVVK